MALSAYILCRMALFAADPAPPRPDRRPHRGGDPPARDARPGCARRRRGRVLEARRRARPTCRRSSASFVPDRHGEVDVKGAYIHGLPSLAVKIASGFFDNGRWGLPSGSGLMVVVSAETGYPQAILLDNGYLTDVRTALAGAAAARALAPDRVRTVGHHRRRDAGTASRRARCSWFARFERVLVYDQSPAARGGVRARDAGRARRWRSRPPTRKRSCDRATS